MLVCGPYTNQSQAKQLLETMNASSGTEAETDSGDESTDDDTTEEGNRDGEMSCRADQEESKDCVSGSSTVGYSDEITGSDSEISNDGDVEYPITAEDTIETAGRLNCLYSF